mgnify:CR=1 FL=1
MVNELERNCKCRIIAPFNLLGCVDVKIFADAQVVELMHNFEFLNRSLGVSVFHFRNSQLQRFLKSFKNCRKYSKSYSKLQKLRTLQLRIAKMENTDPQSYSLDTSELSFFNSKNLSNLKI